MWNKASISVILIVISCIQLVNAQTLSINWAKELPYHGRGETKDIQILKYDDYSVIYRVNALRFTKNNEFIVKYNKATDLISYFDIKYQAKKYKIYIEKFELKKDKIEINKYLFNTKLSDFFNYQQILDTADLKPKSPPTELVDKNGFSYALEKLYGNAKEKKHSRLGLLFQNDSEFVHSKVFLEYTPKKNGGLISIPLDFPNDYFIRSYQLSINHNDQVVCVGLYSKKGQASVIGCYSFVVSQKLAKIISFDLKEFPKELLTKGLDEQNSKSVLENLSQNKEFDDNMGFISSKIHFNKDGSYNLAIEKYRLERVINHKTLTTTYNHFYRDIYVLSFDADGKVQWMQKIPRFADVSNNDSFVGEYFLKYDDNDNMFFIFNLLQSNNIFKGIDNAKTVCIRMDSKGNEKFSILESNTEIARYICPKFFYDNGPNSVVVVKHNNVVVLEASGSKRNTITFGELKLQ